MVQILILSFFFFSLINHRCVNIYKIAANFNSILILVIVYKTADSSFRNKKFKQIQIGVLMACFLTTLLTTMSETKNMHTMELPIGNSENDQASDQACPAQP